MTTWPALKIASTRKIGKHVLSLFKTRAFRDQILENTWFDITFCTGSGRRTPALKFIKILYGVVAPPVASGAQTCGEEKKIKENIRDSY